ncbi:RNA polymerase subunit sigma [Paenibacillus xylanexedens]|uniref:RNA polymerase subunit sigma n=1 Tax=Paenibacillus xylanexedens TaxID=528191 RepID=UPI0011A58B14|nr:RNA polymerase subunit sigma [Paenibacillus xylanexedens]
MKYVLVFISFCAIIIAGCINATPQSSLSFDLEHDEKRIYQQLKDELDESVLLNVDPISVAKMYVYSSYQGDNDVNYSLYTQREGYVAWSRSEDQQIPERDRGNQEQIAANFRNIEQGEFYNQSEYEGYIQYEKEAGATSYFQMIKDENNIWKVAFMPLQ